MIGTGIHRIDGRGQLNANYLIPRIDCMYSVRHSDAVRTQEQYLDDYRVADVA